MRPAAPRDLPAIQSIYAHHVLTGLASFEEEPPPVEEMRRYVLERMEIGREDLLQLSAARARAVQEALVLRGVEHGRLFVVSGGADAVADEGLGRVEFTLLH